MLWCARSRFRQPIEKQLEELRAEKRSLLSPQAAHRRAQQDLQRAKNSLERQRKELAEKQVQLEELAKGIEVRKQAIEAKRLEVEALDAAFADTARAVSTAPPVIDLEVQEADISDVPELADFLKSEAWGKLKAVLVAKVAAAAGAGRGSARPDDRADDDGDAAMPTIGEVSEEQKKALFHAREEGGYDSFMRAFDSMWSEVAAKRARVGGPASSGG